MSLVTYLKSTREELKHVNWPTRREAVSFTLLVIGIAVATAILLGLFDLLFTYLLELLIT